MPVIHIELKRSGVPVSQAYNQIEKYSYEGVFTGLFSLVQVFVAMNPEETRYFANPGPDGKFNTDYYFHWADFNNEPINDWKAIASSLLSIPMAHQLIGFYTVADNADGVLKVMRSYQYYAASAIFNTLCYEVASELKEGYPKICRIHYRTDHPDADAYTMQFLLDGYEDSICPDGVAAAGKAAYVERNQAMIQASDFCVFYFNDEYLPESRKESKKAITSYQPKSGTRLAFDYAKANGKTIINLYTEDEHRN